MKPSNRNHILLQLQCTHTHFYLVLSTAIGAGWTSGDFGKGMLEWFVVGTAAATSRTNWLVLIIAFSMIGRIKSLLNSNFSFPSPAKIGSNRFLKNLWSKCRFFKNCQANQRKKRGNHARIESQQNADLLKLRGSLKELSPSLLWLLAIAGMACWMTSNLASISFKFGGKTVPEWISEYSSSA